MESEETNSAEFEFSAEQEETVGALAKKMKFVGMLLIVVGIITILGGIAATLTAFATGLSNLLTGVVYLLLGLWTRNASTSFQQIVDTAGSDITNLMTALSELLKLYNLQYWIFLIVIVLIGFAFVAGLFAALMGA